METIKEWMPIGHKITPLTMEHFIALAFSFAFAIIFYLIASRSKHKAKVFGYFMLFMYIFDYAVKFIRFDFSNPDANFFATLPLSLCSVTYLISMIALFTNNEKLYRLTVFFCFGAVLSLVGPTGSGTYSFDSVISFRYNLTHILILVSQVFMHNQLGFRITKGDGFRAFKVLILMCLVMLPVNIIFDLNEFYLLSPPSDSLFRAVVGPAPYHLISFTIIAIVYFNIFEYIALNASKLKNMIITKK